MITRTPPEVLTTQKKLFMSTLNEYQKRQYLGTEALALGKRGVDRVSQFFGVSKNTVYSSIDEINSGYTPEPGRIRRSGGGRKHDLNKHPEWFEILKLVIEPHTAGLPQDEDVIWISLSVPMITREMAKEGCNVSEYLVRQMLKQMGYRHRSFIKDLPMKDVKDRNAQFLNIADIREKSSAIGLPISVLTRRKRNSSGTSKGTEKSWHLAGRNPLTTISGHSPMVRLSLTESTM